MENRVFKFRAWDDVRKEMIHDFSIDAETGQPYKGVGLINLETTVLMQSTGMKLKEVEVWEGDLIMIYNSTTPGVVQWNSERGYWEFKTPGDKVGSELWKTCLYNYPEAKVIGNKFTHPSLSGIKG